jgi:hypothetical protein
MQIKKAKWCVSWFNDPYFNSVKFTSLFWALVTAWRCWRNGYTKITVEKCKGETDGRVDKECRKERGKEHEECRLTDARSAGESLSF